jgi:hypothetical protein
MAEEDSDSSRSILILSQILNLCKDRPDLVQVAQNRLRDIIDQCDGQHTPIVGQPHVEKVIRDHIQHMKTAERKDIKINVIMLRDIAQVLAKKHHLDFKLKCKKDIYDWLADKWSELEMEFFTMLDGHAISL